MEVEGPIIDDIERKQPNQYNNMHNMTNNWSKMILKQELAKKIKRGKPN